jgi:hypothetical protein
VNAYVESDGYICPDDECMQMVWFEEGRNYTLCEYCGQICSMHGVDAYLSFEYQGYVH